MEQVKDLFVYLSVKDVALKETRWLMLQLWSESLNYDPTNQCTALKNENLNIRINQCVLITDLYTSHRH